MGINTNAERLQSLMHLLHVQAKEDAIAHARDSYTPSIPQAMQNARDAISRNCASAGQENRPELLNAYLSAYGFEVRELRTDTCDLCGRTRPVAELNIIPIQSFANEVHCRDFAECRAYRKVQS